MPLIAVLTTTATRHEARALARSLVEQGLAACAQISEIESIYRWDGALQQQPEFRVLLKSTEERYAALEAAIKAQHRYALPAIWALRVDAAWDDYAQWVRQAVERDGARPGGG